MKNVTTTTNTLRTPSPTTVAPNTTTTVDPNTTTTVAPNTTPTVNGIDVVSTTNSTDVDTVVQPVRKNIRPLGFSLEGNPLSKELKEQISEAWTKFWNQKQNPQPIYNNTETTDSPFPCTVTGPNGQTYTVDPANPTPQDIEDAKNHQAAIKAAEDNPLSEELEEKISAAWTKFWGSVDRPFFPYTVTGHDGQTYTIDPVYPTPQDIQDAQNHQAAINAAEETVDSVMYKLDIPPTNT